MRLFIDPLDVLFFRDGQPFVAGESHMAQSLFPPTALTFQGAIRSAILTASGISVDRFRMAQQSAHDPEAQELIEEIGGATSFGLLRLRGPFIASMPWSSDETTAVEE
jgi:CRISPR-associated protein Cmr3